MTQEKTSPFEDPIDPDSSSIDDESLALAEAALALAFLGTSNEPLPGALRERIERQAEAHFAAQAQPRSTPLRILAWTGWLAAAASWLLSAWLWETSRNPEKVVEIRTVAVPVTSVAPPRPTPPSPPSFPEARTAALSPTEHPLALGAGGQLIWSQSAQEGALKLKGLADIDPKKGIYQLWIFDSKRDKRYPVDGGTFAISNSSAETVISVKARLSVDQPTLFAVTLEPPGGVVVSDRQRILLTAAWP